jgi:predicted amidophosphoribosyltransferase
VATAEEITEPHLSLYVPPPPAGPGVCDTCHGAPRPGYGRCWSCDTTRANVSHPLALVVPVSLTRTDSEAQLHNVLRDYKHSPDPAVRDRHQLHVAALLWRFLGHHRRCVEEAAGRPFDTITVVPSKSGRTGAHPLEQAIGRTPQRMRELHQRLLEPGPGEIRRNAPADDGFLATPQAAGRQVLLIDDTLTSGAKLQSAASALTLGGATVVAGLVLGRVIDLSNPDRYPEKTELWERQAHTPFTFTTCCLE